MADLSVSPSCGQVQPADPTAMSIDAAEAVLIQLEEESKKAAEKLEADLSKIETKIHRFPARLRCVSKDGRYIVPSVVAIGPYHHRLPQLQKEEVKKAAVHSFCRDSGNSVEEVYKKILSVSGDARSCYDEAVVDGMGDAEFAAMMFRDGCFLLQFIIFNTGGKVAPLLKSWFFSNHAGLERDIILLENQLPWLVFDAFMTFSSVPVGKKSSGGGPRWRPRCIRRLFGGDPEGEKSSGGDLEGSTAMGEGLRQQICFRSGEITVPVGQFIAQMGASFDVCVDLGKKHFVFDYARYKPPHLLGLLRFYLSESATGEGVPEQPGLPQGITSVSQTSSAVELAEIGMKLVASKTTRFKDIGIKLGPLHGGKKIQWRTGGETLPHPPSIRGDWRGLNGCWGGSSPSKFPSPCGELFLPPLVMDDQNACYLVNMVALEECAPDDGNIVTSYIYLLAMLMNRQEDVHELRVKSILSGHFSDQQTLDFIKNLVKLLLIPRSHMWLQAQLDAYKRERWVWIPVHKFVYNNFKTIVTVLSVIGVLVGIFKTLLSLKQHQQ